MKRITAVFLALALLVCAAPFAIAQAERLNVVATSFPPYDFARAVLGDAADLKMLLKPGAESHSYEPTPQDIIAIQDADVFLYVGGENDTWVEKILSGMDVSSKKIVRLTEVVETVDEEIVEGMEDEHGHSHGDEPFTLEDVKDRELTDWAGDWQSVYPYLLDGTLAPVLEHKAEEGDKTVQEYYDQYDVAYKTDVERIVIGDKTMTFYTNGIPATAEYTYQGTGIIAEEDGALWVRYKFEAVDASSGVPKYVMFSDHLHAPEKAAHFHIYSGNEGFDVFMEDTNPVSYPTYYPSELTKDGILDEMLGHEEEHEIDEHVWTSPVNAIAIVRALEKTFGELDPANAATYQANADGYAAELETLDGQIRDIVGAAARKTLVFGDRFPFRYFADEYGLDYYAAFSGCSTETDASPATIAFLIDKVRAEQIPVVFNIELSNGKIADAICEETGAVRRELHSCHNISADDFQAGTTYVELMTANLAALREALN